MDIEDALQTVPYLLDLNRHQLQKLAGISELIEIKPGETPIREGTSLDFLYILLEGEIRVEIFVPTMGQVETSQLGPYDILGWSAMAPVVRQRTGTTTAINTCRMIRIPSKQLCQLCEDDHDIGFYFYRRLLNTTARSFLTTRLRLMQFIASNK